MIRDGGAEGCQAAPVAKEDEFLCNWINLCTFWSQKIPEAEMMLLP